MKPTTERIRELLDYDPLTGVFIWRHRADNRRWNTKNAGKIAGSRHCQGYRAIAIDRVKYLSHHLAWAYVIGEWPDLFVDHKNLDKTDNRFDNLRLASFGENSANASVRSDNESGFRGVSFKTSRNVWHARISKDRKEYFIGAFKSSDEAARAYALKAKELYGDYCPSYISDMAA